MRNLKNKISKPITNCNNNKYVNPDYYSVVVVQTLQERDNIPCKLRQNGMIAIVVEEGYAEYQIQTHEGIFGVCKNISWVQIATTDKIFDGSNLIILKDETHKQEYLQSNFATEGQMIFFVPEQKYYTYDGIGLEDPFPDKLDKPTADGVWSVSKVGPVISYVPASVDISGKADVTAENISAPNVILWRTALDIYRKSEVNSKFINGASETLTELSNVELVGNVLYVRYKGENGTVQSKSVDLSGIVTVGVNISDANYNAATNIITLTDTTGATFTVDLSEFSIITNTDGNGVTTLNQEAVTKLTVSKVGQSGQYADLLGKPEPFVETDTLEDITTRGNITSKKLRFLNTDTTYTTAGDLYFNNTTKNYSFGTLNQNATGINNIGIGYRNMLSLTTGSDNVGYGRWTLENLTTGSKNVALGSSAGNYLTTQDRNTLVGYNAGLAIRGSHNVFMGTLSGQSTQAGTNTASYNVGLGVNALFAINEGNYNTAVGFNSLPKLSNGSENTAIGGSNGSNFTTGLGNLFMGYLAGNIDTGNSNVFLGHGTAGKKGSAAVINSNRNIFIGRSAGTGAYGENNVFIGTGAGFVPGSGNLVNINNRLVIHNRNPFIGSSETESPSLTNAENTIDNGLITGDFAARWVKFNGRLAINTDHVTVDETYTKQVVAKPDGKIGFKDSLNLNKGSDLPTTGMSEGDIFFNTTDKKHYGYNGTVWNTLY